MEEKKYPLWMLLAILATAVVLLLGIEAACGPKPIQRAPTNQQP